MSDQTQQPGDTVPPASSGDVRAGEAAPPAGATAPTEGATATPVQGGPVDSTAPRGAADESATAQARGEEAGAPTGAGPDEGQAPLFAAEEGDRLRREWEAVQAAFVDDPRAAVQRANALVSEVVRNLTESFTTAQSRLEQQWSQGEDVSTEDLRQALHRYRSFFERLLRL